MNQLIEVQIVRGGAFAGKFEVRVMYRPLMEEMFETVYYGDVFENIIDAHRLVSMIKEKMKGLPCFKNASDVLDFSRWLWTPTKASCDGRLHDNPTHVRKVFPTSEKARQIANSGA